jgi:hypothetical protein
VQALAARITTNMHEVKRRATARSCPATVPAGRHPW